jgi:transcription antitermination factor NusG
MKDLFAPETNGHYYLRPLEDSFRWVCAVFSENGAIEVIKRANAKELKTYFPIRRNHKNEYVPLWRSYLFIEFRESVTIDVCRTTTHFIEVVSERDKDGLSHPVLVRKDGIAESLRLMTQGKFDDVTFKRRFHGTGSIVRIIDGAMAEQKAKLEVDVTPDMAGRTKVRVDINGVKAVIELFKLAL